MIEETLDDVALETSQEPETIEDEPSDDLQDEPQDDDEEIEKPRLYANKYKSVEEVEKALLSSTAEATRMAQELAQLKKPKLSEEQQQILGELTSLGVVTKEDLAQKEFIDNLQAIDNSQIAQLGINASQEKALRNYAAHPDNHQKTMTECWNELSESIGGKNNVISRKTTIRPKAGNKGGFTEKTQDELARMPKEKYDKYWSDYAANNAKS